MSNTNNKIKMQQLVEQVLLANDYKGLYDAFLIYIKTYGIDEYVKSNREIINKNVPKVSLICMDCSDTYIENYISCQDYDNVEIVKTDKNDRFTEIIDYILSTDSRYICFVENNVECAKDIIFNMVMEAEVHNDVHFLSSSWKYVDDNVVIAHSDMVYRSIMNDNNYAGVEILKEGLRAGENIYGTLSNVIVRTDYMKNISWIVPHYNSYQINKLAILFQIYINGNMTYLNNVVISKNIKAHGTDYICDKETFLMLVKDIMPELYNIVRERYVIKGMNESELKLYYNSMNLEKKVTFFYTDKGEFFNVKPIADVLKARGYDVKFTEDIHEKAEIGVYSQHICYPENSKFSLILLHDMEQGHNRWPNLWELEPWSGFDVGILPGKAWTERWKQCAEISYVNPRIGTYELGYPKSDNINDKNIKLKADELRKKLNMKYDYTVLYAPSWEYFGKEDDFIKALSSLNVNMLIKQASWSDDYQFVIDSIKSMREMHDGKYDNLYYIDIDESIMTALEMCDMVVSDESNVMSEALMFGKPSVAVTDWRIPDQNPPRYVSIVMDYVIKCKKDTLKETVINVRNNPDMYQSIMDKGSKLYSNSGNVCRDIADIIDYYTQQGESADYKSKKIDVDYGVCDMWI